MDFDEKKLSPNAQKYLKPDLDEATKIDAWKKAYKTFRERAPSNVEGYAEEKADRFWPIYLEEEK